MKAAMDSRPSTVSLKVWLRETKKSSDHILVYGSGPSSVSHSFYSLSG